MHLRNGIRAGLAAFLLGTLAAAQQSFNVGFDQGNIGNWSFFGNPANPIEVIEPSGGNPGAWLHSTCSGLNCLDTFAPQFRAQLGVRSIFTGNYRQKRITSLGIDVEVIGPAFVSTGSRPLTLVLLDDNGTPGEFLDDNAVYLTGPNIPARGAGWASFSYAVPSASTTLPAGWQVLSGNGTPDQVWNKVIAGVDQVQFLFGDPMLFYIFQQWELGVDNVRITRSAGGPG
jgi:hypothetical protein